MSTTRDKPTATAVPPPPLAGSELTAGHLLIAGLSLLLPPALYQVRHLDNNSLTSWQWVFAEVDPWGLWLALLLLTPLLWWLALLPQWWCQWGYGGGRPRLGRASVWLPAGWCCLLPPLAAFLAALLFLDTPEVIVDAARYFIQAKSFSEYGPAWFFHQWGRELFAWTDLPLLPLLYGLLFELFNESRLAAQLLNAAFFAATALLITVLGRDLWDRETGVAGGLLFLGFPYLYSQTPLLLVDIGTMFFLLLAMVALRRALVRGGLLYPLLTAVAVLGVLLSKYSAWLLLSGLLPIILCSLGENRWLLLKRAVWALLPAGIVALLLGWHYREVILGQFVLLLTYQKPGLAGWSESLVSTLLFQSHPLLTAAAFYSLYRAGRRRDFSYTILLWPVFLLLVLLEIRRIRYSIPIMPLLALMGGYGLRDLAPASLRRHLLLVVAGSSLLLAVAAYQPFLQSMSERNLQQAGRYLEQLAVKGAEVVILPADEPVLDPRLALPMLDLFTSRPLVYRPAYTPQPPPGVESSALRFTWEMPLPPFYFQPPVTVAPAALVLITPGEPVVVPAWISEKIKDFGPPRRFTADSGIFAHRTLVTVYGPPLGPVPLAPPR